MSGALQHVGDDAAKCAFCSALAVGPCASCSRPVCGACCTLTEGGVKTWAICLDCDRRAGSSLAGSWRGLLVWLGLILAGIAGVIAVLEWLAK